MVEDVDDKIGQLFFGDAGWCGIPKEKSKSKRTKKEKESHSIGRSDEDMKERKGRMINKAISDSDKFASLSPEAAVLFCMLIPHYNSHGKMNGGSGYIKDEVCPKISYLTTENIPKILQEISDNTNVKYFSHNGRFWIHSLSFLGKHQDLKMDRMGTDRLPNYPQNNNSVQEKSGTNQGEVPDTYNNTEYNKFQHDTNNSGLIQEKSGTNQGEVSLEGEVKGEGEGEVEVKGEVKDVSLRLSELLGSLMLLHNPNIRGLQNSHKSKTIYKWSDEIRRMMQLDGIDRTEEEIITRIIFCQIDNFWWRNVMSGDKLREQYDKLTNDMQDQRRKKNEKANLIFIWLKENGYEKYVTGKQTGGSSITLTGQRTTPPKAAGGEAAPGKYAGLGEEIIIE